MPTRTAFGLCFVLLSLGFASAEGAAATRKRAGDEGAGSDKRFHKEIRPLLEKYCFSCHGEEKKKADLDLSIFKDASSVRKEFGVWEKVLGNVRSREMPPSNKAQPTQAERELVMEWIQAEIFRTDCEKPDPGRVTIRRLNRTEYNNTIRDLVGVDFKPADDFPGDDSGYGFDNIGDVLSLPPVLLEKYVAAADKVLDQALVLDRSLPGKPTRYSAEQLEGTAPSEAVSGRGRMLSREGDIVTPHTFPATGEYVLRVRAYGQQAGPEPVKMSIRLDNRELKVFEVRAVEDKPEVFEVKLSVPQGIHRVGAAYLNNYLNPDDPDPGNRDRNLIVEFIEVSAPMNGAVATLPESHRRIFFKAPAADGRDKESVARELLARFTRNAYRRPVTPGELDRLIKLYRMGEAEGEPFEGAVRVALQAVLVSPHFLFRGELQPNPDNPQAMHQVGEHALASRLSYFIWSSMPDEELLTLADRGRLRRSLEGQVRRMLKDPKARALVENFAGQWLQIRNLRLMSPDAWLFPEFDDALKSSMLKETELFVESIVREDRSILEFIDADYTFVNERLAVHYGIPGVKGDEFQRVSLKGSARGGVLTHASVLTITSNPTRTSPVKRGKWILENILGTPPPPPPANVPELSEAKEVVSSGSLRQRMEQHRENPTCASCHARMDPIGFGFENFDAIGGYREKDGKFAVESAGEFVSGEKFSSAADLRKVILGSKRSDFLRCLSERLLTYGLGRGLEYYDTCAVQEIVKSTEKNKFKFSALVMGIVSSTPFQMRRGEGATRTASAE